MTLEVSSFAGALEVIGTTAGLFGGTPNLALDTMSIQAGTTVQAVSAPFGQTWITVALPTSFPNGILTAVASMGDASNRPNQPPWTSAADQHGFIVNLPGSVVGNLVRVNWIAFGW